MGRAHWFASFGSSATEQIDVLDARLEFGTAVGTLAARLGRVPVVVATGYSPDYWRRFGLSLLGQAAFSQLDALVSDATVTLDEYDRWRWSKRARLVLIPNGLDRARPTRPARDVRAELGLPLDPNVRIVGQVGRLIPRRAAKCSCRRRDLSLTTTQTRPSSFAA